MGSPCSCRIAIFPSSGLGDGLIQLVLAHNLSINGYDVTYFHDRMFQLEPYIHGVTVREVPAYEAIRGVVDDAHVTLYDAHSNFTRYLPEALSAWLSCHGVCYAISRADPVHRSITIEDIEQRLPGDRRDEAARWLHLNRSVRSRGLLRKPVARQLADRVGRALDFEKRSYENGLRLPVPDDERVFDRVVIHPTSGTPSKNWSTTRYAQLARRLADAGWDPARGWGWRRFPSWRPGWTKPGLVVALPRSDGRWQKSVPVARVHRAFDRMHHHADGERKS